ncbi:RNA polymerase sigma-28 factor precursor [uncultured Ruminococcus sp.]|uniref:RNA polymerase sigma factor n=2 Tax=Massiliimalia timonensis TaxID=1987501 RepID=A0A8J6TUE9_9FIRM|nr:RNA polymerase sporulation sigma factor SigK [Massiliimalia timonensis]MBC8610528.1 RNA polymerase sporulation sigma factor SigK [Massiliimalia timonensis]MBS7175471.1 RNA polymerase sporulation sigma factor SigK [Clostridiales bacterium]SCH88457.1 RNA polymerase sigma-28 factor precursor [uncultured Clostridium sp.]SCI21136.1 RNA polymerase sigma-28 factor precursor [uncultured Ruminococcus sp.]
MFMDWISVVMEKLLFLALHVEGIGTFPKPLSAEEERKCFEEMRQGSEEARGKLVEHNLRLVAHIAKKYYALSGDQDDLISIGTIGLIKSISTFSYDKGTRFATYASRCIENEILMHFRNIKKSASDVSISDPIDSDKDGNTLTLMDLVADETCMIDRIDLRLKSEKLYRCIEKELDEREKLIIQLRYGLNGRRPLTQREIAKKLKISRSYVSRIQKKAIATLRKCFAGDEL